MPEEHPLSARELDILRLLAKGISFSQIGHILALSKSTVSTHAKTSIESSMPTPAARPSTALSR